MRGCARTSSAYLETSLRRVRLGRLDVRISLASRLATGFALEAHQLRCALHSAERGLPNQARTFPPGIIAAYLAENYCGNGMNTGARP